MKKRIVGVTIGGVVMLLVGVTVQYVIHPWSFHSPVIYPDGQSIVFSASKGSFSGIFRAPLGGGVAERLTGGISTNHHSPSVSPDQKAIVFSAVSNAASNLVLISGNSGGLSRLTAKETNDINAVFSQDGKRLYFVRGTRYAELAGGWVDYDLYAMELRTHVLQRLTNRKCLSISRPSISLDGDMLLVALVCGERDRLWTFPVEGSGDGRPLRPAFSNAKDVKDCDECTEPQYSQDGKAILFVQPHRDPVYSGDNILIADTRTLHVNRVIHTGLYVSKPVFVHGSQSIVFSATRNPSRQDTAHRLWIAEENGDMREIALKGFGPLLWLRSKLGI